MKCILSAIEIVLLIVAILSENNDEWCHELSGNILMSCLHNWRQCPPVSKHHKQLITGPKTLSMNIITVSSDHVVLIGVQPGRDQFQEGWY